MPTYRDGQNRTIDNFGALSRKAQELRYAANGASVENPSDFGSKQVLAGNAADRLKNFGVELLAREVVKSHGPELAEDVRKGLERVNAVLDKHAGAGPDLVDRRRALLAQAMPHAQAHRHDTMDFKRIAKDLNATRFDSIPLYTLRNRSVPPLAVEHGFKSADAEELVSGLKGLRAVLDKHARQLDSVFSADYAGRDRVERDSRGIGPAAGAHAVERAIGSPSPVPTEVSDDLPVLLSTSLRSRAARRAMSSPGAGLQASPPPRAGVKRTTEAAGLDFPAQRRSPASFAIHEDPPNHAAAAGQAALRPLTLDEGEVETLRALGDQENHGAQRSDLSLPSGRPALLEIRDGPRRDRRGGIGI